MRRSSGRHAVTYRIALLAMAVAPWLSSTARAEDTLYQRLGGEPGVSQIIDRFVALVTTDDRVKDDFDNINLNRLKSRLKDKICQISDGPCTYSGRSMAASHNGLDVTRTKFNAVAEDMQTAMEQSGVPYWTQNRLMARLAPMQRDVVTQ